MRERQPVRSHLGIAWRQGIDDPSRYQEVCLCIVVGDCQSTGVVITEAGNSYGRSKKQDTARGISIQTACAGL